MIWLKAFHVVAMVTWFAALFYLPRLFVYHADAREPVGDERFKVMERRLAVMMNLGAGATVVLGIAMLVGFPGYLAMGWLHVKLTLVALLVLYHGLCLKYVKDFARGTVPHGSRWFRMFNEVPTLLLIGIVVLAIVKPF